MEALPAGEAVSAAEPAPETAVDPVLDVIARSQEAYDVGVEAMRGGETEEARRHFDRALEIIRTCGIQPDDDERLRAAYDTLLENIATLEAELEESPEEPSGDEQVLPADELGRITEPTEESSQPVIEPPPAAEATWDIPMMINDKVLAWVDIFRTRKGFTNSFVGGFERYGWYAEMIHRIFQEEGLPKDLIYLAFMESTYKTNAYSRARAKGIWQFMTPTGREYGLKVNRYVDERSHPEKSTRAAARYLRDLYATFGDWHLAMAAYNTGAGNIIRAQRRSGRTDYWDLAKTRYMRTETKNFVPGILALALMAKTPERYGYSGLTHNPPLTYDRVRVDGPTKLSTLARLSGSTEEEIKFLNPHLRIGVTPPGEKNYEVLVPAGRGAEFLARYHATPESERTASVAATHRVRRGETLASIAARYGTTVEEVARANNLRNANRIHIGMELEVPGLSGTPVSRYAPYHVVRRGETLFSIARAYGISLKNLLSWNGLTERTIIKPGVRLVVGRVGTAEGVAPTSTVAEGPAGETAQGPAAMAAAGAVSVPGGGETAPDQGGEKVLYRVRRGDNLHRIAERFRTTVDNLRAWNKLEGDSIRAGEVLTIFAN